MPVERCQSGGKPGYRWGSEGKCYTYTAGDRASKDRARQKAIAQGVAIGDITAEEATIGRIPFLLTELQTEGLTEGKPFDAFVAGDFVDMHGRRIIVEQDELEEYLENTRAAIEAVRTEDGEVWGLPIDVFDHEKEDAAGWIVGAELEGGVLRFIPKWTEKGIELIERGIRKFFSATFSTAQKVIQGGTLTNWPASRDETGRILLRPIELAQGNGTTAGSGTFYTFDLQEESLDDHTMRIRAAFDQQFPQFDNRPFRWVQEVFGDFVIVNEGAEFFRVEYNESEGGEVEFADAEQWVRVRSTWVEAARDAWRDVLAHGPDGQPKESDGGAGTRKTPKQSETSGGKEMGDKLPKLDDLTPEQRNELAVGLLAELSGEEYDLGDPAKQLDRIVEMRARKIVEQETAKAEREREIAEFAKRVTGGTDATPKGLPVSHEQLEAFLGSLNDEQRQAATTLFEQIIEKGGLVDFSESGHGRGVEGEKELPEEYAAKLDSGELSIDDLKDPVLGLGDLSAYDLSKWAGKQKES